MDLESKITELQNEVRAAEKGQRGAEVVKKEFLPAMPATFELTGHRKAITHVAFHPVFNVCVTASEDSTIKVRRKRGKTTTTVDQTVKFVLFAGLGCRKWRAGTKSTRTYKVSQFSMLQPNWKLPR